MKLTYLPLLLLLLLLWCDRCESLTDNSLPSIFFPFGSDEGDSATTGDDTCGGSVNNPYRMFNSSTIRVSSSPMFTGHFLRLWDILLPPVTILEADLEGLEPAYAP